MFISAGYKSTIFTLDVSAFDTSNVIDMYGMFYETGSSNPNFTLDVSNFDTSKVSDVGTMFCKTGYNSTKLNTSITIRNPNVTEYTSMFNSVATKTGSQIIVNYTSETEALVDQMIATKSEGANVVKGINVQ
jgi:surface protein